MIACISGGIGSTEGGLSSTELICTMYKMESLFCMVWSWVAEIVGPQVTLDLIPCRSLDLPECSNCSHLLLITMDLHWTMHR